MRGSTRAKLRRDFNLCRGGWCPKFGCLGSTNCLDFSFFVAASRLMWGGDMLASLWSAGSGVALRVPVIVRQIDFGPTPSNNIM